MFNKVSKFVDEVKNEVLKVVWPTKKETINLSIMIMAASLLVALFFFLVDSFFIWVMKVLFNF